MTKSDFLVKKLHSLVKTAYGCTEIGAIAYPCAAAYAQAHKSPIVSLIVEVSPYIYRNVTRVGVPNLGFCGAPMIAAAGAIIAKPERKLEMFSSITKNEKVAAKKLVNAKRVKVLLSHDSDPVYCKVTIITKNNNKYEAAIEKHHDNLIYVKKNGKDLMKKHSTNSKKKAKTELDKYGPDNFHLTDLIKFAASFKEKDLKFLESAFQINVDLSEYGKKHPIPGSFTDTYMRTYTDKESPAYKIILDTAAAVDARMVGLPFPVMSSCGSGDHGITLSVSQYTFHKYHKTPKLAFLRGLALANLVTWKIKSNIGELSAFCGSIIGACTGSLAGMAYQANFTQDEIKSLITSCMAIYAIPLCDGAKMSCTFKIASALSQGVMLFKMSARGFSIKEKDGVVGKAPRETLTILKDLSHTHSKDINSTLIKYLHEMCEE